MSTERRISPAEAHAKMKDEGYTYVDVRTEEEFAAGHPEGAVNVPVMLPGPSGMQPNPDFVTVIEGAFAKDAPLVVGCKMGGRSKRAADALTAAGFSRVLDQRAGWDGTRGSFGEIQEPGWSRVGLPEESGTPEGRAYADMKKKTPPGT
jgi:rhodanese-related sulfurtransferase